MAHRSFCHLVYQNSVVDASFAENFYGMKRRRKPLVEPERAIEAVRGVPSHEKLRERDIRMSLAFLVSLLRP